MMRAMLLHRPAPVTERPLSPLDVADPLPRAQELLVAVTVCGVCRTDLHQVEGELPMRRTPVIPGHQVVGTVAGLGEGVRRFRVGDRVGVAWLHATCGRCEFCSHDAENLCSHAGFTGWSVDGGYAEYVTVPEAFAYRVPDGFADEQAAPLLCAGIIGYRALRLSGVRSGQRLGLYGFGASAHIAIQVARHWGCQVYVITRSPGNRNLAEDLGATWGGGVDDPPPVKVHAAVVFAPAGSIVPRALESLEQGGTVALAGIYMSPVPKLEYVKHLYGEKTLRSVANATRRDGQELLDLAAVIPIRTHTRAYALEDANEALSSLKTGDFSGVAVLRVRP